MNKTQIQAFDNRHIRTSAWKAQLTLQGIGDMLNLSKERVRKKKSEKKETDDNKAVTTKKKTVNERSDTWTYIIGGAYRFLIFKEGKLAAIEAGGTAN